MFEVLVGFCGCVNWLIGQKSADAVCITGEFVFQRMQNNRCIMTTLNVVFTVRINVIKYAAGNGSNRRRISRGIF